MELSEYQDAAKVTDQRLPELGEDATPLNDDHIVVPLLGLVGEVGTLHAEYKKFLRDGPAYSGFERQIDEELGDILWYIANLASKFDRDLNEIAERNLLKVRGRFPHPGAEDALNYPDKDFPPEQQLPRQFEVYFVPDNSTSNDEPPKVQCYWNGKKFGNELDDNAVDNDGYRYHDAFHLAYVVYLGWSPVLRKWFTQKRPEFVHRVRDGGRAKVYEEAIAALAYAHAGEVGWFANPDQEVDFSLLKTIEQLTAGLEELRNVNLRQWSQAIRAGFLVWNKLCENEGGVVCGDATVPQLSYRPLPPGWTPPLDSELV